MPPRPACRVALLLLLVVLPALAQDAPPATDVYLAQILPGPEGPTLGPPKNLTDRAGYDNQPHFSAGGEQLLYTSIDATGQADIYLYDLASGKRRQITATPESEYSPTPTPGTAGAISVVRVEADGKQRLWRFPVAGKPADAGAAELILADVEPVGYHAWGSAEELVLFVLGEPATLQRVRLGGKAEVVARDIGRALHPIPGRRAVSFVHKEGGEGWWIKSLDLGSGKIERLARAFPQREDLTWSPAGELWMADGSVVHRWCESCGGWRVVGDLGKHGLGEITRLAIDPGGERLALVAGRGE